MKNIISAFIGGGAAFGVGEIVEHTVGMPFAFIIAGVLSASIVFVAQGIPSFK